MPNVTLFLDQNVSIKVAHWLRQVLPAYTIVHTTEVGLQTATDDQIYAWALEHQAIIITFDEDFAKHRVRKGQETAGVIRLKVEPTSSDKAIEALSRLLAVTNLADLGTALMIIDANRIRIRQ